MPRNISFSLTTPQFIDRTKLVTRRDRWVFLKIGEVLCGVEKSQGLGKGGKIKRLGFIRVTGLRRECLNLMIIDAAYGAAECILEGFPPPHPKSSPAVFIEFYCRSHKGVRPDSVITRIEFEYIEEKAEAA